MRETLAMLVELQQLDDALRELREAKAKLAKMREENASSLALFEKMLGEREQRIGETRAFVKEKEAEIQDADDKVRRSRTRLSSITSQRELTALTKELDTARRGNQQRSEELLKLMEQLEQAGADLDKKRGEREALAEQMKALEASLEAAVARGEEDAVHHTARRKELVAALPRDVIGRYERISRGRAGLAVADLTTHGTCAACNIEVPPQTFIRLQRLDGYEICQNCQRMLVYKRGLAAPEAAGEEEAV